MSRHFSVDLQRLRYWQGQQIKGKDLRDQVSYNALLQAWHNRALHNAYGVRVGLQVLLENDEAVIRAGIAYDLRGRELVLAEDSRFPLPAQIPPAGLYLVAQRKPSGDSVSGIGLMRFCWQDPHQFNLHDGVTLARLLVGPQLDKSFNLTMARPESEPLHFFSDTLPGNVDWHLWSLGEAKVSEGKGPLLGLEVAVDTSAGRFTQTPCYFAWLSGDLWSSDLPARYLDKQVADFDIPLVTRLRLGWDLIQILVMRFGHIAEPTPTGFVYRLWMPRALRPPRMVTDIAEFFALALQNPFTLNWLGIQMDHEMKENYELTGQNPHD